VAWQRNANRRRRLHSVVRTELGELSRSVPLIDIPSQAEAFVAALVQTAQEDRRRLENAIERLALSGTVAHAGAVTLAKAVDIEERLGLSPQDALIYALVLEHIQSAAHSERLFVTQNRRDFRAVEPELAQRGCKLMFAFDAAEAYIRSRLAG
jgi:predicted nucleic acid-binding protein